MSRDKLQDILSDDSDHDAVAALKDDHCEDLHEHIVEAREQQRSDLRETLEKSLRFVPAVLRGRLKKILFK